VPLGSEVPSASSADDRVDQGLSGANGRFELFTDDGTTYAYERTGGRSPTGLGRCCPATHGSEQVPVTVVGSKVFRGVPPALEGPAGVILKRRTPLLPWRSPGGGLSELININTDLEYAPRLAENKTTRALHGYDLPTASAMWSNVTPHLFRIAGAGITTVTAS